MLKYKFEADKYSSVATAIILGIGNCANFISSNIFIKTQAPRYPVAFRSGVAITAISIPTMIAVMIIFKRHNKKVDEKIAAGVELDEKVDYKYVY